MHDWLFIRSLMRIFANEKAICMLSILIPTYNYDCTQLVSDLHVQALEAGIEHEIIVADDASPNPILRGTNRAISGMPHCRLVELETNVGRARIRNLLAQEARHEWLLFMDADAKVVSPTFIADYMAQTESGAEVVCGGLRHADALPSADVSLRYAYERRADRTRAARYREQAPYERFTPFNFMVRRSTFLAIRFDETIREYGHEDTLFGIELQQRAVPVRHIDNALQHLGIENNEVFLSKTRAALRNLASMEDTMQGHSPLIGAYHKLCRMGMDGVLARTYAKHGQALAIRLSREHPSLTLFALYKLAYYCYIKRNAED